MYDGDFRAYLRREAARWGLVDPEKFIATVCARLPAERAKAGHGLTIFDPEFQSLMSEVATDLGGRPNKGTD